MKPFLWLCLPVSMQARLGPLMELAIGETYALVCDAVDVGGLDVSLVVGTDGLEGVIVRHDIKDIHGLGGLPGRILFLATGGGGYRRQTCQNE